MKKMLGYIGVALLVLVAGVLVFAATRPDSFRIERSILVNAPPEGAFERVNDFHRWTEWSPWEGIDPAMKRTYGGPPAGVGTTYAWEGNGKVGSGRMEILEAAPGAKLVLKLDFLAPMEAHNTAEFTFVREGAGTRVTWAMFGPSPFLSKVIGLVFNMDRMVGGMFEQGLANLKARCESERKGG
jgi:uncharacterized protein YndB with AHSA1/START domain